MLGCSQAFDNLSERIVMHLKRSIVRLADIAFSFFLLVLLGPLILLITILVKASSPGPVLYRQTRVSTKGRKLTTLKFRTMRARSERNINEDAAKPWALSDDPIVTPIGYVLRRSSLDELPRFWSVLSGEMSLFSNNNASISASRFSLLRMTMPPLYTLLTRSLISRRLLLVAGFIGISVAYHLSCSDVDSFLNYIVVIFCLGLLFDIALIKLRYKNRIYGTSVQELSELKNFLEANFKRGDFPDLDSRGPLYPQVDDELESEPAAIDGITVRT